MERILWTGRPRQGIAFRGSDTFLIPFSIIWTGFVLFMFAATIGTPGAPDVILLFFLAIGLYFTIGRFIHDAAIRRRMLYAVTDQRLIVASGPRRISSQDIHFLPKLELTEHSDGTGSISFGESPAFFNARTGFDLWVPSYLTPYQFFRIADPRRVYQLIRDQSQR